MSVFVAACAGIAAGSYAAGDEWYGIDGSEPAWAGFALTFALWAVLMEIRRLRR